MTSTSPPTHKEQARMAESKGPTMDARLAQWFASGDTGISSKTIALWLSAGVPYDKSWGDGTPSDGADFGRCYRLMQAIPEFRTRLPEMAARGGRWPALVERWDEIEAVYLREIANEPAAQGKTYKLMCEVLEKNHRYGLHIKVPA